MTEGKARATHAALAPHGAPLAPLPSDAHRIPLLSTPRRPGGPSRWAPRFRPAGNPVAAAQSRLRGRGTIYPAAGGRDSPLASAVWSESANPASPASRREAADRSFSTVVARLGRLAGRNPLSQQRLDASWWHSGCSYQESGTDGPIRRRDRATVRRNRAGRELDGTAVEALAIGGETRAVIAALGESRGPVRPLRSAPGNPGCGVETLEELELAAHDGRLETVRGFGGIGWSSTSSGTARRIRSPSSQSTRGFSGGGG